MSSPLPPCPAALSPQIPCRGKGESPEPAAVNRAVFELWRFWEYYPDRYVLMHCTHGFNRTGKPLRLSAAVLQLTQCMRYQPHAHTSSCTHFITHTFHQACSPRTALSLYKHSQPASTHVGYLLPPFLLQAISLPTPWCGWPASMA